MGGWEEKNREQFGDDWPEAKLVLAELEDSFIFMLDPSPSNIRFRLSNLKPESERSVDRARGWKRASQT